MKFQNQNNYSVYIPFLKDWVEPGSVVEFDAESFYPLTALKSPAESNVEAVIEDTASKVEKKEQPTKYKHGTQHTSTPKV